MKSRKNVIWFVLAFILGIFLPYMVPVFNQLTPKLFHIPFTVWWTWLMVALFCVCLFIWSRNGVFETYDNEPEKKE